MDWGAAVSATICVRIILFGFSKSFLIRVAVAQVDLIWRQRSVRTPWFMNLMVVSVSYLLISIKTISVHFFVEFKIVNNCKLDHLYNEIFIIFEIKNQETIRWEALVLPGKANFNSLFGRMRWSSCTSFVFCLLFSRQFTFHCSLPFLALSVGLTYIFLKCRVWACLDQTLSRCFCSRIPSCQIMA